MCAAVGCGFELPVDTGVARDAGRSIPDGASPRVDAATPKPPLDGSVPPADAESPLPVVGALRWVPTSLLDRVAPMDGPLRSDDVLDGVFDVQVDGAVVALALLRTDTDGNPIEGQQWDTYVDADVWPEPLSTALDAGRDSYQLGVLDATEAMATALNAADGRCRLASGAHTLRLAAHDVGAFVPGNSFRLVVESEAHQLVRGPVLTLP